MKTSMTLRVSPICCGAGRHVSDCWEVCSHVFVGEVGGCPVGGGLIGALAGEQGDGAGGEGRVERDGGEVRVRQRRPHSLKSLLSCLVRAPAAPGSVGVTGSNPVSSTFRHLSVLTRTLRSQRIAYASQDSAGAARMTRSNM